MQLRGFAALAAVVTLTGCPPSVCTEMCMPLTMSVEFKPATVAYPLADGALVPWVHGFQGGTMVQPILVLDPMQVAEGEVLDVTITHTADPAAPDMLGEAAMFPRYHVRLPATTDEAGRRVVGPLLDQLGWNGLDGVRLTYALVVGNAKLRAEQTAVIHLGTPEPPSCSTFTAMTTMSGCRYRVMPGTLSVVSDLPMTEYVGECVGGSGHFLAFGFAPDDPTNADDCATGAGAGTFGGLVVAFRGGSILGDACVASHMLALGDSLHTNVWVRTAGAIGDCPAFDLHDLNASIASCACPP